MKTRLALLAASLFACTPVEPGAKCTAPLITCGDACVDPQNDSRHCGACGAACAAGQRCTAGACEASCPAGAPDLCGTGAAAFCTRLSTDAANCGACGAPCPQGMVCASGTCAANCGAALALCGSGPQAICADLSRDTNHCGSCGEACAAGQQCVSGSCACPAATPDACGTGAAAFCTNRQNDQGNCGACGTACAAGKQCVAGSCACAASTPDACGSGAAAFCTNLQGDQRNCGACGTACAAGKQCVAGSCACAAATPDSCGTGAAAFCTNLQADQGNCGACGTACAAGKQCVAGTCECAATTPDACGTGAAAFCTNLQSDQGNCGACGTACAAGKQCVAGSCACATATPDACGTGAAAFCTNFQSDQANCGACGVSCLAGEVCAGNCVTSCPASSSACPATGPATYCARLTEDDANCGSCGNVCSGGTVCAGSTCVLPAPRQLSPLSTDSVSSRQPVLRWLPVSGATGYVVELCATRACANVTATLSTTNTSVAPASDLARGVVFWRVRGANPGALFGPVWEFFVGPRSAPIASSWGQYFDVNGDGLPDVAGSSMANAAYVYLGSSSGLPNTPSVVLPANARTVANGGDLNGDGYGDLLVGTPYGASNNSLLVYFGAAEGPATTASRSIITPDTTGTDWGAAIAGLGDVNGDGYADLAGCFGSGSPVTNCYVYLGGTGAGFSSGGAPLPGFNVSGAGDVNADGYSDAVVRTSTGVSLYLGGATGLTLASSRATPAGQFFLGESIACAGDVNGDGYADVVAGTAGGANAYVFMGSSTGISATAIGPLPGATGGAFQLTGNLDTAGDVNGDGYSDIVFGKYNGNAVAIFHGSPSGIGTTPATNIPGPSAGDYGAGVLGAGDLNGDGFDDIVMAPGQCSGHNTLVLAGSSAGVVTTPLNTWAPPGQCFGNLFSR